MGFDQKIFNPVEVFIEKKDTVDEKWYERFKLLGSFEEYDYLGGEKKNVKKKKIIFLMNFLGTRNWIILVLINLILKRKKLAY